MVENSKTIDFFYEISKIPRESGNEGNIAKYLCEFAKKRNLEYECDRYNNVFIKKKTADKLPIILQAHTDMVCEKEENLEFNFTKEPISIINDGEFLKANGTTLGADNGIGVAQILNLLDSDIPCNIEAVFTTEEETSMNGAINFNTDKLQAQYMLNLDGFKPNTIVIESAGFNDIVIKSNYHFEECNKKYIYEVTLTGLEGGHSGFDIDKNKGNASIMLAKALSTVPDICLCSFVGGTKFNVIPSSANAVFYTSLEEQNIKEKIGNIEKEYKKNFKNLTINIKNVSEQENSKSLSENESRKMLEAVYKFMHGVRNTNENGQPTTSANLGVVNLEENVMKVGMRSSRKAEEKDFINEIKKYCTDNELKFEIIGSQPGFETSKDNILIKKLLEAYPDVIGDKNTKEQYNKSPSVEAVHVTVELGFFQEKIKNLQVAIISPDIRNAHTVRECVEIESIKVADKWLENLIRNF